MPTLSAHTDEATASRVREMAKLEDRTPSQITAAAVRWYVRLSASARAAGRALLDREYKAILDRGLTNYTPTLPAIASDEAILAEAVRITRHN
jgi:predicted transcriptional regulator